MARRTRTDRLTEVTRNEVAYLAHAAAYDETYEGRLRAADQLLRLLNISDEEKAHGAQRFAEVREYRQRKQAQRRPATAPLTQEELDAHIAKLKAQCERLAAGLDAEPSLPAPIESDPSPVIKTPTERMRKAVAKFDALPEDEQVDQLRSMWGDAA